MMLRRNELLGKKEKMQVEGGKRIWGWKSRGFGGVGGVGRELVAF